MTQTTYVPAGTQVLVHSLGDHYPAERATVVSVELSFNPTVAHLNVRYASGVERWVDFEMCEEIS